MQIGSGVGRTIARVMMPVANGGRASHVQAQGRDEITHLKAIEGMLLRHCGLLVAESRRTEGTLRTLHVCGQ